MSYPTPTPPAGNFIRLLLTIIIVAAAIGITLWVLSAIPMPPMIYYIIVGVIALLCLAAVARWAGVL